MQKTEDLRKKDKNELLKSVRDLKKKLSDIRFKFASNQVKNIKDVKVTKKEIARILTIIKEIEKNNNHA